MAEARFLPTGDTSVCVEFGNEISEKINSEIRAFNILLNEEKIKGIIETVPTYRSIMVHYDPGVIPYRTLIGRLKALTGKMDKVEIPVLYGGEMGPELAFVAQNAGISEEEVVKIHTSTEYLSYMLGFTPGFTYLGGMSDKIATPRLKQPRVKIPAGSVGIAGKQTGIYPIDSPGGWQLIGRTPVKLYDAHRDNPILLDAGLHVKFIPVDESDYKRIENRIELGRYHCHTYVKEDA